jgi:hypothetical protein
MNTVAETDIFQRYAATIWSNAERMAFIDWIAANPLPVMSYPAQVVVARYVGADPAWVSAAAHA